jgi:hypothetical protein
MRDLTKVSLPPKPGDTWRVNFYSQEFKDWRRDEVEHYIWVPTGKVSCHIPSAWGYIVFTEEKI